MTLGNHVHGVRRLVGLLMFSAALVSVSGASAQCTATTCRDMGDATATCTSAGLGYVCSCTVGFISNGVTCVSACSPATSGTASDPCGSSHGTCSVAGPGS